MPAPENRPWWYATGPFGIILVPARLTGLLVHIGMVGGVLGLGFLGDRAFQSGHPRLAAVLFGAFAVIIPVYLIIAFIKTERVRDE